MDHTTISIGPSSMNYTTISMGPSNSMHEPNIRRLPSAMTASACVGIAWYLCAELNVRLLLRYTRRSLYFWACLLCSWGIIIQMLAILLNNFEVWTNYSSIVVIHLTWATFVLSQSVVLYSRLNLVLKKEAVKRAVLYMIIFTSVVFGITTVVFGMISRYPTMIAKLLPTNLLYWDRVQLIAFFIQETIISLLYIRYTASHLKNMTLLGTDRKTTRRVLQHLICVNVFIICLDCTLIGLCFSGAFFLQGFFKGAMYAVKLRTEFSILEQLRSLLSGASGYGGPYGVSGANRATPRVQQHPRGQVHGSSQDSDVEMVGIPEVVRNSRAIRVQTDYVTEFSKAG